ncbi:hypothetical protein [Rhizobium laguerreae]|uniref:hypothetical protein n=1 Tax=Rhizobium laguerreae TaxID=1076926 RepID=UPI001C9075DE|nr:hypothetical protein [Rhizobium laguerreae]MBY3320644.1 hypothetical protein [Rhizobium laguerreae]
MLTFFNIIKGLIEFDELTFTPHLSTLSRINLSKQFCLLARICAMRTCTDGPTDRGRRAKPPLSAATLESVEPSYEPRHDEWLTLNKAVCLPEFGGSLYRNQPNRRGILSVKTLREAIARGELAAIKISPNKTFVTRDILKEWSVLCRAIARSPTSTNALHAMTQTGNELTKPPSSSEMATTKLPQAAVSLMLNALGNS